jgi:hypothetical protein
MAAGPVWQLDRFGRSLVDCLNNIKILEENGIRFISVTQGLDTDLENPASRFLLHVLGAAAEFERALIRERTQAGRLVTSRISRAARWAGLSTADPGGTWRRTVHEKYSIGRYCSDFAKGGHIGESRSQWAWGWGRWSGRYRIVPKVRKLAFGTERLVNFPLIPLRSVGRGCRLPATEYPGVLNVLRWSLLSYELGIRREQPLHKTACLLSKDGGCGRKRDFCVPQRRRSAVGEGPTQGGCRLNLVDCER